MAQPQIKSSQLNKGNLMRVVDTCIEELLQAPVVVVSPKQNEVLTFVDSKWINRAASDVKSINFKLDSKQADETTWRISNDSSQLVISTRTDDGSVGTVAAAFKRNGTSIESITFGAPTTVKSKLTIQAKVPALVLNNTESTIDEKVWDIVGGKTLQMRTRTDAYGTGATFFEVKRNNTTPSLIRLTAQNIELVGNTTITNLVNIPTSVKPTFTIRKETIDVENDPHLSVKASRKGQYFRVDVYLTIGGGGTGGFRWNVAADPGEQTIATARTTEIFLQDGVTNVVVGHQYGDTAIKSELFPENTASVKITFTFKLLEPDAPIFNFQWAQETSTTSGVTLEEGCNMVVTPLG